jgi:AAA ATPase domain
MDSRRNVTSSVDGTGTTIGFRDGGARMAERSRNDALVGRQHELAALRGAVDRAAQGSGGAVVVLGEAEIGKSRLLAEVARRAAAQGMQVLAGTAVPGGGAFRAIAAALTDRLRDRPGGADHREDGWRDDEGLRPFLPALNRLVPTGAEAPPAGQAFSGVDPIVVLGEGVLRLLGLLAADRGVWADRVDAVAVLRVDLAEHERAGDPRLARTCRDLLRRAGAPTRRGRGATPSRRRCGRPG